MRKKTEKKTKRQISFAVTAKLISAFVFATRIVHFLYFLNPKFPTSKKQFAYAKTKRQISFAVTAKLISAFVFATRIVHFLYFMNPKFPTTNHLL